MPFLTFFYSIGKSTKRYLGKNLTDWISDDHDGLDTVVEHFLRNGINTYRIQHGGKHPLTANVRLHVAILSLSSNTVIPSYFSKQEYRCFDFYMEHFHGVRTLYVNGKKTF